MFISVAITLDLLHKDYSKMLISLSTDSTTALYSPIKNVIIKLIDGNAYLISANEKIGVKSIRSIWNSVENDDKHPICL